jgi:hypothetical protein
MTLQLYLKGYNVKPRVSIKHVTVESLFNSRYQPHWLKDLARQMINPQDPQSILLWRLISKRPTPMTAITYSDIPIKNVILLVDYSRVYSLGYEYTYFIKELITEMRYYANR